MLQLLMKCIIKVWKRRNLVVMAVLAAGVACGHREAAEEFVSEAALSQPSGEWLSSEVSKPLVARESQDSLAAIALETTASQRDPALGPPAASQAAPAAAGGLSLQKTPSAVPVPGEYPDIPDAELFDFLDSWWGASRIVEWRLQTGAAGLTVVDLCVEEHGSTHRQANDGQILQDLTNPQAGSSSAAFVHAQHVVERRAAEPTVDATFVIDRFAVSASCIDSLEQ